MAKTTESAIELLAIQRLETLGYHYLFRPDIAPGVSTSSANGVIS